MHPQVCATRSLGLKVVGLGLAPMSVPVSVLLLTGFVSLNWPFYLSESLIYPLC